MGRRHFDGGYRIGQEVPKDRVMMRSLFSYTSVRVCLRLIFQKKIFFLFFVSTDISQPFLFKSRLRSKTVKFFIEIAHCSSPRLFYQFMSEKVECLHSDSQTRINKIPISTATLLLRLSSHFCAPISSPNLSISGFDHFLRKLLSINCIFETRKIFGQYPSYFRECLDAESPVTIISKRQSPSQ